MRRDFADEMREVEALYEAVEATLTAEDKVEMTFCRQCPLQDTCVRCRLYLGCVVWEASMGDDL